VYSSNIATAEEKAAAPVEQVKEAFRKLNKQQDAFKKQVADAHNLILRVAPTPDALELSKQTGKWEEEFGASGLYESGEKITKELLAEFDRKANEVLGKIKMLPTLSRAQVEKDYNDFPDEKMR
jgi:hypothetical protein